jgi:proline racemase
MRSVRTLHCVESHTEGMPTRVVVGGTGVLPGDTMERRRQWFLANSDHLRTWLMNEPHGHSAMSGAILQPSTRPDADWGVLYIEVSGCLPMCGHGTIGVATVLVETGMVTVTEPTTTVRLDTPAGLVVAEVAVHDGQATQVTIRNVASFVTELDATVDVPGYGTVRYDMAFGGNFYAIVELDELGVPFGREHAAALMDAGMAVMDAIAVADPPQHPHLPGIRGCHHVQLVAPGSNAQRSRHAMVIHPGWFDRSPCGTGTSARMAQLHRRGLLDMDTDFHNESLLGRHFTGRLVEHTDVAGIAAVVPTIAGRAWITGTSQHMLAPDDPFPVGFRLDEGRLTT